MKLQINFNTFLIIAAFAVLLWFSQCGDNSINSSQTDTLRTETTFIYDTTIHHLTKYHVEYIDTGSPVIPPDADTALTFSEYYTPKPFNLSWGDSNLTVNHSGILYKNAFFESDFRYTLNRPTSVTNTTIRIPTEPRLKMYIGGLVGYGDTPKIGALISLQNKRENLLTVGAIFPKTYVVGYQGKITFKR